MPARTVAIVISSPTQGCLSAECRTYLPDTQLAHAQTFFTEWLESGLPFERFLHKEARRGTAEYRRKKELDRAGRLQRRVKFFMGQNPDVRFREAVAVTKRGRPEVVEEEEETTDSEADLWEGACEGHEEYIRETIQGLQEKYPDEDPLAIATAVHKVDEEHIAEERAKRQKKAVKK
jgi:hypothetical protein